MEKFKRSMKEFEIISTNLIKYISMIYIYIFCAFLYNHSSEVKLNVNFINKANCDVLKYRLSRICYFLFTLK